MTRRAKIETWSFDLPRRRRRRALCQFLYFYISWLHDYESLAINYFRDTLDTFASIYHTHTHTHTRIIYCTYTCTCIYTQHMYTRIYCGIYLQLVIKRGMYLPRCIASAAEGKRVDSFSSDATWCQSLNNSYLEIIWKSRSFSFAGETWRNPGGSRYSPVRLPPINFVSLISNLCLLVSQSLGRNPWPSDSRYS